MNSQHTMTEVFYKARIILNKPSELDDYEGVFNNWWALFALVLVVGTAAGNILVCLAITWERRLQNVTNYFLMSLAITDLMVAVLVMPLGILTLVRGKFTLEKNTSCLYSSLFTYLSTKQETNTLPYITLFIIKYRPLSPKTHQVILWYQNPLRVFSFAELLVGLTPVTAYVRHTPSGKTSSQITRVNMNDAELVTQTKNWRLDRTVFLHFFHWQWNNTVLDIFLVTGSRPVYKIRVRMSTTNSINNPFLISPSINRSFFLVVSSFL